MKREQVEKIQKIVDKVWEAELADNQENSWNPLTPIMVKAMKGNKPKVWWNRGIRFSNTLFCIRKTAKGLTDAEVEETAKGLFVRTSDQLTRICWSMGLPAQENDLN